MNKKVKIEIFQDDGLVQISDGELSENEPYIMDSFLTIDEVGNVDLDNFNELLERII